MFLRMVVRSFRTYCASVEIGAVMYHGLAFVCFQYHRQCGLSFAEKVGKYVNGGVLHWLFTFKCCHHEALHLWNGLLRRYDFLKYTHDTSYGQASYAYIDLTNVYT